MTVQDDEANARTGRAPLAEALELLRQADESTAAGFDVGPRDAVVRSVGPFAELWESDPTFRGRWRPRPTRLRQIYGGRDIDKSLREAAAEARIRIA